uniref:Uncharacterized protein LOC104212188 n=1 Tax=Nicotiana sylvestris TaxID=4096 RepID=A0A1U7UUI0_NICSY|nr:PREDICTED: uncharacterized protein LOC104212188 [Nicotiana sylvestris]
MTEEAPPAVKKLLEAWLTNTLTSILDKPAYEAARENARICIAPTVAEQNDPLPPETSITHNVNIAEIVYALEKLEPKVKWPQKMRSDPSTRESNAFCEFHQEQGHKTEDCIALMQEVVNMLHQRHLKELLSDRGGTNFAPGPEQHKGLSKPPSRTRTIQMIMGGSGDTLKFTTTHKLKRSIIHEWYDELEESTIFNNSDTHGLVLPHYDALVINLRILDTNVRLIMMDDGSSTCIIHPRVLAQMKLEDKIVSHCITLTGFNNAIE